MSLTETLASFFSRHVVDRRARRQQRIDLEIHRQVEMRDGLLGLEHAPRDDLADGGVRHAAVARRDEHRLAAGAAVPAPRLSAPEPPQQRRPGLAFSTSALTMRPLGPVPLMPARSTPFSAAMRLASGEAKMRAPPEEAAGAAGAGAA